MQRAIRKLLRELLRKLSCVATLAALAPVIAACSSDGEPVKVVPRASEIFRPDWTSFSGHKEEFDLRPPGPEDLVSAEGYCPGMASEPGAGGPVSAQPTVQGGVALQMTECDVVRRAGLPERVQLGANERGERAVELTYTKGHRPGIYRFARGRLVSVERVQQPTAPARPKASPAKKQV